MTKGITIITPTGGRRIAFSLCEEWISRQTFNGDIDWIVVDDGEEQTPCTMDQRYRYRGNGKPDGIVGTLPANVLQALKMGPVYDKIVFIEDDDWYAPDYLETYWQLLDHAPIVGEGCARYYHLRSRRYRRLQNKEHASLSQTGIRAEMLGKVRQLCTNPPDSFIDLRLWEGEGITPFLDLDDKQRLHCALKALPGRTGIGNGHTPGFPWNGLDQDWSQLRAWVGDDVEVYQRVARECWA